MADSENAGPGVIHSRGRIAEYSAGHRPGGWNGSNESRE